MTGVQVGDVVRLLNRTHGLAPAQPADEPAIVLELVNAYSGTIRTTTGAVALLGDYTIHARGDATTVEFARLRGRFDDALRAVVEHDTTEAERAEQQAYDELADFASENGLCYRCGRPDDTDGTAPVCNRCDPDMAQ